MSNLEAQEILYIKNKFFEKKSFFLKKNVFFSNIAYLTFNRLPNQLTEAQ